MKFEKVTKGTARHKELTELAQRTRTHSGGNQLNYNELAQNYNELGIGEFLSWPRSKKTLSPLRNHLKARGLEIDDFDLLYEEVKKPKGKIETRAVLVRLTATKMSFLTQKRRGPRKS